MTSKVNYLFFIGLLLIFLTGCGQSGTLSGTTFDTIVGTWNESGFTGDGGNLPTQFIFANGKGSFSGPISGSDTFIWTYQGTTLTIIPTDQPTIVLTAPPVGTVTSPLTLTTSTGGTATYNR